MRYSFIVWIGSALASVVACGDGDPLGIAGSGGTAGAPSAGESGHAGEDSGESGGTAGATTGGSSGKGGKGGAGRGGAGNGGVSGGGKGGKGGRAMGGASGTGEGGEGDVGGAGTGGSQIAGSSGTGMGGSGGTGMGGSGGSGDDAGAGGTDDGGEGGASDGGAGGVPSSCEAGQVSCGEACVDPAARTLDQRQLDMPGSVGLSVRQRPGQSFTVGTAGRLKGIEVAVGPCNDSDTAGQLRMELFDSNQNSLGQVSIEQSSLPEVCGGNPLVENAVGAGYFDLTPLCLAVEAGTQLTFMLSVTGNAPGTCDQTTYTCSNSASSCDRDRDCEGFFYVGETNCGGVGCQVGPDDYAGGVEVMQDPTSGTLSPDPGFDLAFKTFVQ